MKSLILSCKISFINNELLFIQCKCIGIRQIIYYRPEAYLMKRGSSQQLKPFQSDQTLFALQSKLSLKGSLANHILESFSQKQQDQLFPEYSGEASFNQLFNNTFNQNNNFSEIHQQQMEDDSFFNQEESCFPIKNTRKGSLKIEERVQSSNKKCQREQIMSLGEDRRNEKYSKILSFLKQRDQQGRQSIYSKNKKSISVVRSQTEDLTNKAKTDHTVSTSSQSILKIVKKISSNGQKQISIAKRVRTQSNEPLQYSYKPQLRAQKHQPRIFKTQYEPEKYENLNNIDFDLKDSLQCTFKPTILKQIITKTNKQDNNSKSQKRILPPKPSLNSKPSKRQQKMSSNSQPLKSKDSKNSQTLNNRPTLAKKSSSHISSTSLDVAARNQMWLAQKQEKLVQKRKEQEQQKFRKEDYTFKPSINSKKEQNANVKGPEIIPPFFQRLSIAKKKNSAVTFKKQQSNDLEIKEKNKQNLIAIINNTRELIQPQRYSKKTRYEEAIKELHHKIMKMNL